MYNCVWSGNPTIRWSRPELKCCTTKKVQLIFFIKFWNPVRSKYSYLFLSPCFSEPFFKYLLISVHSYPETTTDLVILCLIKCKHFILLIILTNVTKHSWNLPMWHVVPSHSGGQRQTYVSPRSWQVPPLRQVLRSQWLSFRLHVFPFHPSRHVHKKSATLSVQLPLFRHGLGEHSSLSVGS